MKENKFIVYTDGSCDNIQYPNYGGWAYLVLENNEIIEQKSGNEIHTTNNKMELTAILNAVSVLPFGSEVEIITDSKYCIGLLSNQYNPKTNIEYLDTFNCLVDDKNLRVSFKWVKGHSGDKYNEIVDKLANDEYEKAGGKEIIDYKRLKVDKAYRHEVYKKSRKGARNKMLAELVQSIIDDDKPKGYDYIDNIVNEINLIFKL